MVVDILCLGEDVEETMNTYAGRSIDWWETPEDHYGNNKDALLPYEAYKTVGDIQKMTLDQIATQFWAIATESDLYRNQYNVMTHAQLGDLFRHVLNAYDNNKEVKIVVAHI